MSKKRRKKAKERRRDRVSRESLQLSPEDFAGSPYESLIVWGKGAVASIAPTLKPDEDFAPVMLAVNHLGHPGLIDVSGFFRDDRSKNYFDAGVTDLLSAVMPKAVLLINTVWMRTAEPGEKDAPGVGRVSEHPDRREAVCMQAYDGKRSALLTSPITRRTKKHPLLGEWERLDSSDLLGRIGGGLKAAFDVASMVRDFTRNGDSK